jgi:hypothetical protein
LNKKLIRISTSIVFAAVILGSSFACYFLSVRAGVISTANSKLKDELIKLKAQQDKVENEKAELDKQYNELQQKLNKFLR